MKTSKKIIKVNETLGTVELKIAKLQKRLKILKIQAKMSQGYPEHQQKFREALTVAQQKMAYLTELKQQLPTQ